MANATPDFPRKSFPTSDVNASIRAGATEGRSNSHHVRHPTKLQEEVEFGDVVQSCGHCPRNPVLKRCYSVSDKRPEDDRLRKKFHGKESDLENLEKRDGSYSPIIESHSEVSSLHKLSSLYRRISAIS
jgi:hypothetical protein